MPTFKSEEHWHGSYLSVGAHWAHCQLQTASYFISQDSETLGWCGWLLKKKVSLLVNVLMVLTTLFLETLPFLISQDIFVLVHDLGIAFWHLPCWFLVYSCFVLYMLFLTQPCISMTSTAIHLLVIPIVRTSGLELQFSSAEPST